MWYTMNIHRKTIYRSYWKWLPPFSRQSFARFNHCSLTPQILLLHNLQQAASRIPSDLVWNEFFPCRSFYMENCVIFHCGLLMAIVTPLLLPGFVYNLSVANLSSNYNTTETVVDAICCFTKIFIVFRIISL